MINKKHNWDVRYAAHFEMWARILGHFDFKENVATIMKITINRNNINFQKLLINNYDGLSN